MLATTVGPPNSGHIGTTSVVLYSRGVLIAKIGTLTFKLVLYIMVNLFIYLIIYYMTFLSIIIITQSHKYYYYW